MKAIKWTRNSTGWHDQPHYLASMAGVTLSVFVDSGDSGRQLWKCSVNIGNNPYRYGPRRTTILRAQQDAQRMTAEMLTDHHASIVKAMKKFEVDSTL